MMSAEWWAPTLPAEVPWLLLIMIDVKSVNRNSLHQKLQDPTPRLSTCLGDEKGCWYKSSVIKLPAGRVRLCIIYYRILPLCVCRVGLAATTSTGPPPLIQEWERTENLLAATSVVAIAANGYVRNFVLPKESPSKGYF